MSHENSIDFFLDKSYVMACRCKMLSWCVVITSHFADMNWSNPVTQRILVSQVVEECAYMASSIHVSETLHVHSAQA